MKVLLTGATGLLGGAALESLLSGGHDVRCLVRRESPNAARVENRGVEVMSGDARSGLDLRSAFSGTDAVLHVAGIEFAPQVVAAAREAGVERLVCVSSTSAHSRFEFRSGPKLRMERVVKESSLAWTLVRPTMIYGSELDRNIHKLLRFLDRSPVFPMFGGGENLWQPVYFGDCAKGVCEALFREGAIHRSYDLPGARPLTYNDLVRRAAEALGKFTRVVHVPLEPVRRTLAAAERLRIPFPVKSEQVLRLSEDKAYPFEEARKELGYEPRTFSEGVAAEVGRLRGIGLVKSR